MIKLDLDKNQKYILGCSFGPDSMALFHLLLDNGYDFVVCNIDYNYRPESKWETDSIEKACKEKNIDFYTKNVLFSSVFHNFEGWARKIRYDFFKEIGNKIDIKNILIAHQKDELIETYLMQKERNSIVSFYGLAHEYEDDGFKIIRPLLNYTKEELMQYCDDNGYEYSIDPTNFDTALKRNYYRHKVLKNMTLEEKDFLIAEINDRNSQNKQENEEVYKIASDFINKELLINKETTFIQKTLIAILSNNKKNRDISRKTAIELKNAIELNRKRNFDVDKDSYISFDKKYLSYIDKTINYCLPVNNEIIIVNSEFIKSKNSQILTIKPAKLGSNYKISNYTSSINRLFIDWKIPIFYRNFYPAIFNDEGNIVYLPRYRASYKKKNNSIMTFDLNNFYNYLRNK